MERASGTRGEGGGFLRICTRTSPAPSWVMGDRGKQALASTRGRPRFAGERTRPPALSTAPAPAGRPGRRRVCPLPAWAIVQRDLRPNPPPGPFPTTTPRDAVHCPKKRRDLSLCNRRDLCHCKNRPVFSPKNRPFGGNPRSEADFASFRKGVLTPGVTSARDGRWTAAVYPYPPSAAAGGRAGGSGPAGG